MTNNLLNKNFLIGALIILLLLTSWWGQSKTGTSHQLTLDKEKTEVQLVAAEKEIAEARQALEESTTTLSDTEEKLRNAENNAQNLARALAEKKSTIATLEKEKENLLDKIKELSKTLDQTKTQQEQIGSEQQEEAQKALATAAEYKEALEKLEQAEVRIAELEKEQENLKIQANARLVQLQQQQEEAATELESLRAQVIGFEKVVEERNAALTEVTSDLEACKVNTKVLLAKITEQEDTQLGMEKHMRNIVENLSKDVEQEEQA
ncbi:MAG: hypothetical protein D3908_00880, partial [Candidatus Electrothrix sp. AUS4]|nr:hypothetical protein [Candidatus Electrothrix sp. AUS4]